MLKRIVELLHQKGYELLENQIKGVYVRETEEQVYVLLLYVYRDNVSLKQCEVLKSRVEFKAAMRFGKKIQTLVLFCTENGLFGESALNIANHLTGAWFLAMDTGRIYIFENQPAQFDDLQRYLENGLAKKRKAGDSFRFTPANMLIVACNIIYFILIMVCNGGYGAFYDSDIMLAAGALSYDTFINGGWYRIVTSMFMHFGFSHLANNMILLTYVGCELERRVGVIPYVFIYFVSGVIGNFISLGYYNTVGDTAISAGASGAIFGVFGALALNLIRNHTETPNLTARRLLVLSGLTIYHGMSTIGVDNAAHIGGLIGGVIGEFLLSKISQYGKLE